MQEKNDFKMKPALDVSQIYPKLLEIGISQKDINYLNRNEEWKSIQFEIIKYTFYEKNSMIYLDDNLQSKK